MSSAQLTARVWWPLLQHLEEEQLHLPGMDKEGTLVAAGVWLRLASGISPGVFERKKRTFLNGLENARG